MPDVRLAPINIRRLCYVFASIFFIEAAFLIIVERERLMADAHELVWVSFMLHAILAFYALLHIIWLNILKRKSNDASPLAQRIAPFATFTTMMIVATISVFDQVTHGHITLFSVFLLAFGLLVFIRPWWNLFVYGIPFMIFMLGVIVFQENTDIQITHFINGTVVFVGVLFASTVFYRRTLLTTIQSERLQNANEKLTHLATIDTLTELPNRRLFERHMAHELSIAKRYDTRASLMLIDIDDFKAVNDTYGHHIGDLLLSWLGELLSANVRASDMVARWGGEEFMILLSHTECDGANILAERLRESIANTPFIVDDTTIYVTISIGISPLFFEVEDAFTISYQTVDKALYIAKNSGKNCVKTLRKPTLH